jgi:large subunit ribosomal protein L5
MLEEYRKSIVPEMMKQFSLKNPNAVPRLEKIVVNMGVGEATQDVKILEKAMDELAVITGQRPVMRRAKKAISNFKVRRGDFAQA